MKKLFALTLCAALLLTLFAGCGAETQQETQPTEPTEEVLQESPEEAKVLKILIIGSSRSVNTFHMLYEAFKDQMPDQELVLGVVYYSGCSMTMHRNFTVNNEYVYDFYCNTNGIWEISPGFNMDACLKAHNWDVVQIQAGNGDLNNKVNLECRTFLRDYIDKLVEHPHQLWWHSTWFNSTDPALYGISPTKLHPEDIDQYAQITNNHEAVKEHVFNDPMFAGRITSGTPMMYALKVLEVPEVDLYRDHTHLSDFGCLLVAYSWYAQYTGNPVTEIGIDVIPAEKRQKYYRNLGDLEVTQEMKDIILKSVDYTLNNPWAIPVKE